MFTKNQTVNYFPGLGFVPVKITIENVFNGMAVATSGSHGDTGPFLMTFDAESGEGIKLYAGTRIEAI